MQFKPDDATDRQAVAGLDSDAPKQHRQECRRQVAVRQHPRRVGPAQHHLTHTAGTGKSQI